MSSISFNISNVKICVCLHPSHPSHVLTLSVWIAAGADLLLNTFYGSNFQWRLYITSCSTYRSFDANSHLPHPPIPSHPKAPKPPSTVTVFCFSHSRFPIGFRVFSPFHTMIMPESQIFTKNWERRLRGFSRAKAMRKVVSRDVTGTHDSASHSRSLNI